MWLIAPLVHTFMLLVYEGTTGILWLMYLTCLMFFSFTGIWLKSDAIVWAVLSSYAYRRWQASLFLLSESIRPSLELVLPPDILKTDLANRLWFGRHLVLRSLRPSNIPSGLELQCWNKIVDLILVASNQFSAFEFIA